MQLELFDEEDGKGIDDVLANGGEAEVFEGEDAMKIVKSIVSQADSASVTQSIGTLTRGEDEAWLSVFAKLSASGVLAQIAGMVGCERALLSEIKQQLRLTEDEAKDLRDA